LAFYTQQPSLILAYRSKPDVAAHAALQSHGPPHERKKRKDAKGAKKPPRKILGKLCDDLCSLGVFAVSKRLQLAESRNRVHPSIEAALRSVMVS
jgi:hypothetical protein